MDYQQVLTIMMIAIFASYVTFIGFKYGIQKSISDSFYSLPKKMRPLFTFALWGFAMPAAILANGDGLMFFAASGIMFVAAAANMRDDFVRKVHMIGAIGGITLGELSIIFIHDMWWVTAIAALMVIPIAIFAKKTRIWWAEIIAFATISFVYVLEYF